MQDLFIIKLMNNFTVAMKSGGAMALPAPPVAPPLPFACVKPVCIYV